MNKRFLLVAALCAAMNAASFAQTNLALNKPIYPLGENSFRTSEELKVIDDGNEKGGMVELFKKVGDQKYFQDFYIDLESEESIGQIAISWEGACAKDYKLFSGVKNGDEFTWTEIANQEGLVGGGGADQIVKYNLSNVKTQYIKFAATAAHNEDWNVKMYEMSIYKAEATALTSLKASKSEVKVGEEFTVDVLDQFGKTFTGEYTLEAENAEPVEGKKNTFKALADGVVKISVKDTEISTTINAYAPAITTLNVAQGFIMVNEATALTITAKDQQGAPLDLTNATYTVDNGATFTDGKLITTNGGKITITATLNGKTATANVYALDATMSPKAPIATEDNAYSIYGQIANADKKDAKWRTWQNTNVDMPELTIGDKTVKPIKDGFKLIVSTQGSDWMDYDNTQGGYDNLAFNVFPTADCGVKVTVEPTDASTKKDMPYTIVNLKAGQWQRIDLAGIPTDGYIIKCVDLEPREGAAGNFCPMLISDIYFYKVAAGQLLVSEIANEKGFYTVTGNITKENADKISELAKDGSMMFDLRNANIADDVTTIKFMNPNSIVLVAGNNGEWSVADKLTGTNNLITTDNTWYYAAKPMTFVDGYPICTSISVDTGKRAQKGYTYTRTIAADAWGTTYLNNTTTLPEGLKAYTVDTEKSNGKNIVFKEANELLANTPYLLHNTNATEATFTMKANGGDFNLTGAPTAGTPVGDVVFQGNLQAKNGTGAEYGIQNATGSDLTLKKVEEGATIGTFRAYFTVAQNAEAKDITFTFDNDITGINDIQAVDAANKVSNIYSIDGKLVKANATSTEGLAKGVYIVNGKKVIVK